MSKQSKIVGVAIDARAKRGLANASKSVAEVATALIVGTDDKFGVRRPPTA
jgi:hypothetical protein